VLESVAGEIDVVDVDVQGWEGPAMSAEARQMMEQRVKAAFIAPHDQHVHELLKYSKWSSLMGRNAEAQVRALYDTFSSDPWRAICLQHPTTEHFGRHRWNNAVCDGVIAALNTRFYDVVTLNETHVHVANRACSRTHHLTIPLMNPFAAWPPWKDATLVGRDAVYQLWGTPWGGWLDNDEGATFMGLKFVSSLIGGSYRRYRCYAHKAILLREQEAAHKAAHRNSTTPRT